MNKSLVTEYRSLQSNQQFFTVSLVDDNIYLWRVVIKTCCFDSSSQLYQQLSSTGTQGVLLELKFAQSYTSVTRSPPWCRIISPKLSGGGIYQGSVCWEGFYDTNRTVEYNMENLLVEFAHVLSVEWRATFDGMAEWSVQEARKGEQFILGVHTDWKQTAFV
ncbi:hypothetical protein P9112_013438 [Eukaryota sp. TZLM1-RC]